MQIERCGSCKWWTANASGDVGDCHLNPQIVMMKRSDDFCSFFRDASVESYLAYDKLVPLVEYKEMENGTV